MRQIANLADNRIYQTHQPERGDVGKILFSLQNCKIARVLTAVQSIAECSARMLGFSAQGEEQMHPFATFSVLTLFRLRRILEQPRSRR
jgi:hypothetical protein